MKFQVSKKEFIVRVGRDGLQWLCKHEEAEEDIWSRRLTVFELIRESWKAYDNVRWHEPSGGLGLQRVSLGYPPPVHSRMFVHSIGGGKHSATQCQVVTVVPCVLICLPPEPLPSPSGVSADPLEYPGARETPEAHVSAPSFSCPLSFNALVPDYT